MCAAAGPAVEGSVAHVCRLPDAEACSVLEARSIRLSLSLSLVRSCSLSLSQHTFKHTHSYSQTHTQHKHTHTPMALAHTTRTHRLQHASLAWERKKGREREEGSKGGMGKVEGVIGDYRGLEGKNTKISTQGNLKLTLKLIMQGNFEEITFTE